MHLLRSCIFLTVLAILPYAAMSQPAPDCANCACAFPAINGVSAWTAATHPDCDPNNPTIYTGLAVGPTATLPNGRFIRFTANQGSRYTFTFCAVPFDTYIYVTTNNPGIPGSIVCDNDGCGVNNGPSQVSFIPPATGTYRIYVFNGACNSLLPLNATVDMMVTCTPLTVPDNNLPCFATPLPMNGTACNYHSDDNAAATNAGAGAPNGIGNIPVPSCGGYQGADQWYSVTVPASGLIGIQTQEATICAGAFSLYTATACNNGTTFQELANSCTMHGQIGPNSVPANVFDAFAAGLSVGATVYIRYWEQNANENGAYQICAYEAQRPPNDDPCDAIALTPDVTCIPQLFSFENASPSDAPAPGCGSMAYPGDVWFTFEVPVPLPGNWTGISAIADPNNLLDLSMAWYRPSPGCDASQLDLITCSASGTINSVFDLGLLDAGETIYVRLWNENQWIGTFNLCVVINQAPVNDDPCGAEPLPVNHGCIMTQTSNGAATLTSTAPFGTINVPNPTCGFPYFSDVWYTVTMPPNGQISFNTQAGGLVDGAIAVYRVVSGSCAGGNLSLAQIDLACVTGGSTQGNSNLMPGSFLINQPTLANQTLYVRVWRQGAANTDGSFNICATRTDPPPGNCAYTLNMNDSGGDGWGGSYVTVCVGGTCTDYTVLGSSASISFGALVGQLITISYTPAGGQQQQISFNLTNFGQAVFVSGTQPSSGLLYAETVECNAPPAPSGDCAGAISLCNDDVPFHHTHYNQGHTGELNNSNSGCMSGESQGVWLLISFGEETPPCSPAAFDIVGVPGTGNNNIFDFVIWGPYPHGSTPYNICPITQLPYRCNWASLSTPTVKGLAFNNNLPVSQNGAGGPMAKHMVVNPGDVFMLFVNNWSNTGQQFNLVWKTPPNDFEVLPSDCTENQFTNGVPIPAEPGSMASVDCNPVTLPVELITFSAIPIQRSVHVEWSTGMENGSSHFIVERTTDGEHFIQIGLVHAMGHTLATTNYQFIDEKPYEGLSYYRLQQVDLDGSIKPTHMVPVVFRASGMDLQVYPNPASSTTWLAFRSKNEEHMLVRVLDASGRSVLEQPYTSTTGLNELELPITMLDQGSYMVELLLSEGHRLAVGRFVKQ